MTRSRQIVLVATLLAIIGTADTIKVSADLLGVQDATGTEKPRARRLEVTTAPVPRPEVPISTLLAAPRGTIPTYSRPGSVPKGTLGTWYRYSLVLPVIAQQSGWLQVRLPQRPNGSATWVKATDVALSTTPYRIVIDLGARHLVVYKDGYRVLEFPAGIGTTATPTVTGSFFVAVRESSPSGGYGSLALDTSAHSEAIRSWQGSGDAIIAIHGPITSDADGRIGTTGARLSNGCIRLHNRDLAQLAVIPVGTPVDIDPGVVFHYSHPIV